MSNRLFALAAPVLMMVAGSAAAQANNNPPPLNPIFGLTGLPQTTAYTNYTFSFVAQFTSTNLTFALRNDPVFIKLDDISMSVGAGPNLIVNGGFESGVVGEQAPVGWTYLNQYGATAGGVVTANCGRTGGNCYYDGAVQAYDAITQLVSTTVGTTYNVSFWAGVSSVAGTGLYQALSTNGASGTGGNGIDLFVYVGQGAPVAGNPVPEPATWGMMVLGFAVAGAALRRRTTVTFAKA